MANSEQQHEDADVRGLGWLFVAIVIALVIGYFTIGPGSDAPPDAGRPVRLVMTVPANKEDQPLYREVIARFEAAHSDVHVELRPVTGDNYYQKILVMMASGMPPDLLWMGEGFSEFARRGAFMDITDRIARDIDVKDFLPQALEWYRLDGRQLGVPYLIDVQFVLYNKDLFDEAGVAYPKDGWTFDEFLADAKKLTRDRDGDGRTDQYGYYGSLSPAMFGAAFVSADGSRATCNTPEMIDYIETSRAMFAQHKVSPLPQEIWGTGSDDYTIFRQRRAAMMEMHTWDLPYLRKLCADMNWDIALHPRIRQRAQWASSAAILASSKTRYPEQAWALCREFLSPEFQLLANQRGGLPPSRSVARRLIEQNTTQPANLAALVAATDCLHPNPRVASKMEIQQQFSSACDAVWMNRMTPEQAMIRAEREINRVIAKNGSDQ